VNFYRRTYWHDSAFEAVERFMAITDKYRVSPMALALGWVRSNPVVTACIVGARTEEQLEQNLKAWGEPLPAEALAEATAVGDWHRENAPWVG
jgi:aryl-alcohol dehydrogenase-like predicted oxidoreductase